MMMSLTPTAKLRDGETVLASCRGDRMTYWREMAWLAAIAMVLGMVVLWLIGNPHVWTGGVGGLAAIMIRALYLATDDLKVRWDLTDQRLLGPGDRDIALRDISIVRPFLSAVQIVTANGDKHLIKYQADRDAVVTAIQQAPARTT
ncbi:hypothetical protein [Octadecabacter ascidiaceicola]|uniref:DUF304 domain-containing protein n=1 Tax=Octadecabacter ascidiaceicola TaxID=1655543 RepID=A0A238KJ38_9RHOB|nr:hypothetical protein [Octadecabacter ascidiaceicola]SMX42825.1 hypothetical protein OCA8868_02854 [Octadecabacter ascidiaceicola]